MHGENVWQVLSTHSRKWAVITAITITITIKHLDTVS